MTTIQKFNLDNICRSCKSESEHLQSVYVKLEGLPLVLAEMLMACTSIQVEMGDGLPSSMCVDCVNQLNNAYNFKEQCEKTDISLRDWINNQLTEEPIDEKQNDLLSGTNFLNNDNNEFISNEHDYIYEKEFQSHCCTNCPQTFPTKHELQLHQQIDHVTNDSLTCKICLKKFEFPSHLERHMRIHNPPKIYICKICDKRLTRLEHLKRHMIIHLKIKPHVCKICNRGFNHPDNLINHLKRCKGDRTYVCEICNRGFNRPDGLEAHMGNHDPTVDVKPMLDSLDNIERYILVQNLENDDIHDFIEPQVDIQESKSVSDTKISDQSGIDDEVNDYDDLKKSHRTKHKRRLSKTKNNTASSELVIYSCKLCDKKFKRSSHLKRHMLGHGEVKPFCCNYCPKKFTRRDHMLRHIKLHNTTKQFKCDICSKDFNRNDQLQQHKAVRHAIGEKKSIEKKFQCDVCNKCFTTEKYRDTHVKAHNDAPKEKEISCKACFQKFECKNDLQEHEKQNIQCSKKYLCSECGQRFMKKNYLVVHMRRHRGEKPYKCRFCNKGFPRSTDVTRHEKFHTGEKNHLCIICGKGFGRAYNLTLHMRTHTGEKPYQCTYCEAAFAQSNDLKAHIRRHTGERYHCDLCNDAFLMGYLLKQHKKNVHGVECQSERIQPYKKEEIDITFKNETIFKREETEFVLP